MRSQAPQIWNEALAAERTGVAPTSWFHGDLLAENLLVRAGRLAAVLDLGGVGTGDPTVDLIVAWEVLDPSGRERFRSRLGVDDATWAKGRGWALVLCLMTFDYYWHTMPTRCAARRSMVEAVLIGD